MKKIIALFGGIAGAATAIGLHEVLKVAVPSIAPRMDLLDMELIGQLRERAHLSPLPENKLSKQAFIAEAIAYVLYFSLAGGKAADVKGATLGIAAGISAVQLPEKLNLDAAHSRRTKTTEYLTIGHYVAAGLMAAATVGLLTEFTEAVEEKAGQLKRKIKKTKLPEVKPSKIRRRLHL